MEAGMPAGATGFEPEGIGFDPNKAVPGDYPEDKSAEDEFWRAAFDHAAKKGCTKKASALYADAHAKDFEAAGGVPTEQDLLARVKDLEEQLAKKESGGKAKAKRSS